jgi:hypothetical protein
MQPNLFAILSVSTRALLTKAGAESKKHGVWDHYMPELTINSPYVHSRVDYNTFTMGNRMPESTLILCQSRLYISPILGFCLCGMVS